ncbi:MAG: PDZ domain-containing protein [Candidatus Schekmanbacteria bacterium]|nr:PDZ domain-containing protein [Candidatus Schekmanbacteria bacterium]
MWWNSLTLLSFLFSFPLLFPVLASSQIISAPVSLQNGVSPDINNPNKSVFFGYLRLVGTAVYHYNPRKNKAVIEDLATQEQHLLRLDSLVPYGAKIVQIGENSIVLEKEEVKRELTITGSLHDPGDLESLTVKGYKQVSGTEWIVNPNRLIKNTEGLIDLLKQVNLSLYSTQKAEGFLVGEIRSDGMAKELGLDSGDVINTVDGETIESLAQAYEAYQKMRGKQTISVNLNRRGRNINLSYHLIPDGLPKYKVQEALKSPYAASIFSAAR